MTPEAERPHTTLAALVVVFRPAAARDGLELAEAPRYG
jgi:hypothetical protein